MRHKKLNKRFSRNRSARLALIRDLAKSVLSYESITTTKRKAKEARKLVEQLITLGKEGSLNSRRLAYKKLCDHSLVSLLFTDIAPRFKNRLGGHTRIYALLDRRGDGAEQVILELSEKKKKEKPQKIKTEKKEKKQESAEGIAQVSEVAAEEKEVEKEVTPPKKLPSRETKKVKEETEVKVKPEEKSAPPIKEKHKHKETKPPTKFLGGLRKFFKKKRDSL